MNPYQPFSSRSARSQLSNSLPPVPEMEISYARRAIWSDVMIGFSCATTLGFTVGLAANGFDAAGFATPRGAELRCGAIVRGADVRRTAVFFAGVSFLVLDLDFFFAGIVAP